MPSFEQIMDQLHDMKDSAIGSGIYFLYGIFFKKTNFWKGFASFVIGTVTAQYLSPEVLKLVPNFSLSFVSFVCGLLGMRITEYIIEHNGWKKAVDKQLNL